MAQILAFPGTIAPPDRRGAMSRSAHRAPCNVHARRFMTVDELAGRLGLHALDRRTILDRLRLLHDQAGLPAPRTPHARGGQLLCGAAAIHARALWDRGVILCWLDHPQGPTALSPSLPSVSRDDSTPATRATAARLGDRAAALIAAEGDRKRA